MKNITRNLFWTLVFVFTLSLCVPVMAAGRKGDVNGDGSADACDAALILRYTDGRIGADALDLSVADTDESNTADGFDAARILRYSVGLVTEGWMPEPQTEYVTIDAVTEDGRAVATLRVPADWEGEPYAYAAVEPLPRLSVEWFIDDKSLYAKNLGLDAYEAAGVSMPADLEEYSQRPGVRQVLLEGEEFAYDEAGNLLVTRHYTEDGVEYIRYYCLKQAENCFGSVVLDIPADKAAGIDVSYMLANSSIADREPPQTEYVTIDGAAEDSPADISPDDPELLADAAGDENTELF